MSSRQGSIYDLDIDMFLKISNYEDTVRQLDIYYGIGENYRLVKLFSFARENRLPINK